MKIRAKVFSQVKKFFRSGRSACFQAKERAQDAVDTIKYNSQGAFTNNLKNPTNYEKS